MGLQLRLKLMYRRYVRSVFRRHALAANVITSGLLMWMGDFFQQKLEKKGTGQGVDKSRSAKMFGVGLLEGPPHHFYYSGIDKLYPGRDLVSVTKKVLADQVIASPLFIVIFFYGSGFFEGLSIKQSTEEITSNIWTVYAADWCVWPPTQFLNFYLVPGPYRVLYVNFVSVIYNVFLSYIKHKGKHVEPIKEKPKKIVEKKEEPKRKAKKEWFWQKKKKVQDIAPLVDPVDREKFREEMRKADLPVENEETQAAKLDEKSPDENLELETTEKIPDENIETKPTKKIREKNVHRRNVSKKPDKQQEPVDDDLAETEPELIDDEKNKKN